MEPSHHHRSSQATGMQCAALQGSLEMSLWHHRSPWVTCLFHPASPENRPMQMQRDAGGR